MKDLTREGLEILRQREPYASAHVGDESGMTALVSLNRAELFALLDMAGRAVSEEALRSLANSWGTSDEAHEEWCNFCNVAGRDLREAASAIRDRPGGNDTTKG